MKKIFLLMLFLSSSLSLKGNCGFYAEIDYLFWNISQVNMPYAVSIEDLENFANFEELRQEDHWASGFRVVVGKAFCCIFDTSLSWTRFHTRFKDRESDQLLIATELLAPNIGFIIGGDGVGGPASSKWHLDFNVLDWHLGTPLCLCESVRLKPYIGLKAAFVHQQQCITYENFLDTNTDERVDSVVKEKNHFHGVGPKVGLASSYFFCRNWSLNGEFAASLLCGNQRSPSTISIRETSDAFIYSSKFKTNKWRTIPSLQTSIGISWRSCICNCFPILIGLSYESNFYWDLWRTQNSIIQQVYITDASYGALMLQGVTAKVSACF